MARSTSSRNNNNNNARRSGRDRRQSPLERPDEEQFLYGKGRFSRLRRCLADRKSTSSEDVVTERRKTSTNRRFCNERRSAGDRRSGSDTRSEIERFLQGERRSGVDRRSRIEDGYQTFKKARAFVRSLGLKSLRKWDAYIKSGMNPDNIPVAPHAVYANSGWAGWNDWLGR